MKELSLTEKKIIAAAAHVFLEKGLDGARMQEIANLAGINKALLHYYFRSKDKLYEYVAEREIRLFFTDMLQILPMQPTFEIWLRTFIHHYMQTLSEHPELSRFMLWEIETGGLHVTEVIKDLLLQAGYETIPFLTIFAKAVQEKQIRPTDPVNMMISLLGLCVFPFIARPVIEKIVPKLEVRSKEFLQKREQAVFDMVWNGLRFPKGDFNENATTQQHNDWLFW